MAELEAISFGAGTYGGEPYGGARTDNADIKEARTVHALPFTGAGGAPENDRSFADWDLLADYFDVADEPEWQERALCAQTDPEAFFPEKGGSTREAKRICSGCEVRAECLEYALEHDERFGIWGGLSERERRKLKKRAI